MWTAVDHFKKGILAWVIGDHSSETFRPLWELVKSWGCYFGVADLRYESSLVEFLKPRPKLTFRWVQGWHSYLDSATPMKLPLKL